MKDVSLQDTRKNPPPVSLRPKRLSALQERNKGVTDEIIEVIIRGDILALAGLLEKSLLPSIYTLCEPTLAYECVRSGSIEVTNGIAVFGKWNLYNPELSRSDIISVHK